MAIQTEGIVLRNRRIKSVYFLLEMDCPSIANEAQPGQFVMVRTSEDHPPLLRRPFSIYRSYPTSHPTGRKRGQLSILYKKVGIGTRKMTTFRKGQKVNLIGPVGNGFSIPPLPSSTPTILIGGGVGMASLSALGGTLGFGKLYVFIGGKTKDDILCEDDFPKGKVFIATEDGSRGQKGTVVDLFLSQIERFDRERPHHVYVCGPEGMFKSLAKVIQSKRWNVQVSLEARMGCGFGACWGCVVKTRDTEMTYRRVCKDGPVFPLSEIVWE
jgi:dihydroorotate dehydrogenase electron transfer subunit